MWTPGTVDCARTELWSKRSKKNYWEVMMRSGLGNPFTVGARGVGCREEENLLITDASRMMHFYNGKVGSRVQNRLETVGRYRCRLGGNHTIGRKGGNNDFRRILCR